MVPLVFLINGLTKHDWKGALFLCEGGSVGLTSEMLPMIVSVCLAKGAIAMSRTKASKSLAHHASTNFIGLCDKIRPHVFWCKPNKIGRVIRGERTQPNAPLPLRESEQQLKLIAAAQFKEEGIGPIAPQPFKSWQTMRTGSSRH